MGGLCSCISNVRSIPVPRNILAAKGQVPGGSTHQLHLPGPASAFVSYRGHFFSRITTSLLDFISSALSSHFQFIASFECYTSTALSICSCSSCSLYSTPLALGTPDVRAEGFGPLNDTNPSPLHRTLNRSRCSGLHTVQKFVYHPFLINKSISYSQSSCRSSLVSLLMS